tara:strand:+ start:129 stop:281 length:153 start_codon:yes stop_codon:yes gene_type:complete
MDFGCINGHVSKDLEKKLLKAMNQSKGVDKRYYSLKEYIPKLLEGFVEGI